MSRVITPLGIGRLACGAEATRVLGLGGGVLIVCVVACLGVGGFGLVGTVSGIIRRSAFTEGACGAGLAGAGGGCCEVSFDVVVGDGLTTAGGFCRPHFSSPAVAVLAGFGVAGFAAVSLWAGVSFGSAATLVGWAGARVPVPAGPISAASEFAGIRVPARGVIATSNVFEGVVSSLRLWVGDATAGVFGLAGCTRSDGSSELISTIAGRSPGARPLIGLPRFWCCVGDRRSLRLTSMGGRPLPPITTVLCARASMFPNRAKPILKKAAAAHGQPVGVLYRSRRPVHNGKANKRFREDSSALKWHQTIACA